MPGEKKKDGILASARAGLLAAALAGLVVGLVDGVWAACTSRSALGALDLAVCLAAAVVQYTLLLVVALVVLGVVLHPLLKRRELARRYVVLLALGLGAGAAAELYWRTRELLFYGRSAVSPERLAVLAACVALGLGLGFVLARGLVRLGRPVQIGLALACALAWLGGGLFLAGQGELGGQRGLSNERNRDLPNVLLVVVDALRADVLGCYGNARVKTPNIDALAARGVVFENAFVQAPFTWTSFGSLLTGKYPRRHGLIKMKPGYALRAQATLPWHLKHATRDDGRALQEEDWITASFHTGTLQERSGLLRGFDLVFEETAGHDLMDLSSAWSPFESELLLWVLKNRVQKRFDSGLLAREASKWIESVRGRRFMAMVHLYPTHTPYDPPQKYKDLYCDPAYSGPVRTFYAEHRQAIESKQYAPTAADVEQIQNLYYAGVAQADALVGDLLTALEKSGALANTLVIVTADHGESLGEDGLWEHNHMVRRELRVPLVLALPGRLPAGKRVQALTDEIDVLPTACALVGVAPPPETDVYSKLDGVSLLPLVRGAVTSVRRFSFAENGVRLSIQDLATKLDVSREVLKQPDFEKAEAQFERERRIAEFAPRFVEFDPKAPLAEHDRLAERRTEARALLRELFDWSRSMPIAAELFIASGRDEETEALFRKTGYEGGIGDDDEHPPSPKSDFPPDDEAPPPSKTPR
ncbi:MAG: sulfatase-like hydrolase/transferase [Planctomycetes bacterium]|nr:sulfatase-like hydrolase/transferase [Planctomycetota bacterium]